MTICLQIPDGGGGGDDETNVLFHAVFNPIIITGSDMRWVVGSIPDGGPPLRYFSFQPVLLDWCNKGSGMYYPDWDCGYKKNLAVNRKESVMWRQRVSSLAI